MLTCAAPLFLLGLYVVGGRYGLGCITADARASARALPDQSRPVQDGLDDSTKALLLLGPPVQGPSSSWRFAAGADLRRVGHVKTILWLIIGTSPFSTGHRTLVNRPESWEQVKPESRDRSVHKSLGSRARISRKQPRAWVSRRLCARLAKE